MTHRFIYKRAGLLAAGRLVVATGEVLLSAAGARGQAPPQAPVRAYAQVRRPLRQLEARAARNPDLQAAVHVLQLYLQNGQKQPYVGEQTTQVIAGGLQSTEIVKHGGPGKERIEFQSPPRMAGEVILQNANRFLHYVPRRRVVLMGVVSGELFEGHVRELQQGIRAGRVSLWLVGSQEVAGQPTSVIEIRTAEGGWRLYIDDHTGVRLKSERLGAGGNVAQTSYFTRIDYNAQMATAEFTPQSLPPARRDAALPSGPPLPTVQAAQQQVAYPLREPALPAGFRLVGIWVVATPGNRKITVLRYTDGANTFTLWEQPARPNAQPNNPPQLRRNLGHWISGGVAYTLIGNLRPETQRQIVDSLR